MDDDHYLLPKEILAKIFRVDNELWYASRMVCNQIRKICTKDILSCECLESISLYEIQREIDKDKKVGICINRVMLDKGYKAQRVIYQSTISIFENKLCNTRTFLNSEQKSFISCDYYKFGYNGNFGGFLNDNKLLDIRGDWRGRNLTYPVIYDIITTYNILKRRFKYLTNNANGYAKTICFNIFNRLSKKGSDIIKNIAISYYYMCILGIGSSFPERLGTIEGYERYQNNAKTTIIEIIKSFDGIMLNEKFLDLPSSYLHEDISIHKYKLMKYARYNLDECDIEENEYDIEENEDDIEENENDEEYENDIEENNYD